MAGFVYLIFNPRFNWMKGSVELLIHTLRGKIREPRTSLFQHASRFETRYWATWKEYRHQSANNAVLLTAWALMCWAAGPLHFFAVYLASLSFAGGIGMVLFTVQHNFDHAYASSTDRWDPELGTLRGTSFMVVPGWMNWFTANIGYHHVHHLSAAIPNYRLIECHREYETLFQEVTRIGVRDIPHALKNILWDRQAQQLITVAEYEAQIASAVRAAA